MRWHEIFALSNIEILSLLILWSRLNPALNKSVMKNAFIIVALSLITVILDHFDIAWGFVINFTILCALVTWLFKIRIRDVIVHFFIILAIFSSVQLIFTYALSIYKGSMNYSFNNGIIINLATLTVCLMIYKSSLLDKTSQFFFKYYTFIAVAILNITVVILLSIYAWQIDKVFIWRYFVVFLAAIIIWEVINIYFVYQLIKMKEQEKEIRIHEKYIPFLKNLIYEVRQQQHEFKNHLNTLYGIVEIEGDHEARKEVKEYLEALIGRTKPVDQLLNIKDPILSAIIYSKKALAEEKNIAFSVDFEGEIPDYPLGKHDLVELLGNLLNNAIEVAASTSNGEVILTLGTQGTLKTLQVKNTCQSISEIDMARIFDRAYSTKKGKHRGYGLYNVKKIVAAYKGTIELSFDEQYVVFKILF
jgi:two-component system sensor histidine kinase AgrC